MHVLFVCTGNTCRSPMAEGFFKEISRNDREMTCSSAGIGAASGQPPSRNSVSAMDELDINIQGHRSKPVTQELVNQSDFILVMTYSHLDNMLLMYPQASDRIFLIREFIPPNDRSSREVSDPFGQSIEAYRISRNHIRDAIKPLYTLLKEAAKKTKIAPLPDLTVSIGADHGGYELRTRIVEELQKAQTKLLDVGSFSREPVDYPDLASLVCQNILEGKADRGILICKSGIGMSMTANHFHGIRAALVHNDETARLSREHNDANVLCLPANELTVSQALKIVDTWLRTPFSGGRHARRIEKMETLKTDIEPTSHLPSLQESDPAVFDLISKEHSRQKENIELIASENFTSRAVMEAQGSCLTNKYAEGYPQKRWYGGCEYVDEIEQLAIDRAKELFGAEFANVQPHSGSQANFAVYTSVLQPGDKILGMNLSHGGHLTHGNPANFSGKLYQFVQYGVRQDTGLIDYDELAEVAQREKPKMITVGASAYSRIIDFPRMSEIAKSVGAYLFADIAHIAGLVAAGVHPSPVGYADFVTTTTHKTLRGPRGGLILCKSEFGKGIDSAVFPGAQGGPLEHIIAAKAVCFKEALQPSFKVYQQQVVRNAKALAEGMKKNGYSIFSGGTDNHLMLVDLQPKSITGKEAQEALDHAGITCNKNAVPYDTQSPFKGGGIRLGTPAVTTRGMKEDEMFDIANWIHEGLQSRTNIEALHALARKVHAFTAKYPLPY
jgi:glycine hydroxymethyltransferase